MVYVPVYWRHKIKYFSSLEIQEYSFYSLALLNFGSEWSEKSVGISYALRLMYVFPGSIELEVSKKCDIAGLRKAIRDELEEDSKFSIFYWELCLDEHHSEETKLVDLGHPVDELSIEYPTAGRFSDGINKPDKVKISSDKPRKIIQPKPARTAEEFYCVEEIDGNAFNYQLTSSVSLN